MDPLIMLKDAVDDLKKEVKGELSEVNKKISSIKETIMICVNCILNDPENQKVIERMIEAFNEKKEEEKDKKKSRRDKILGFAFSLLLALTMFLLGKLWR